MSPRDLVDPLRPTVPARNRANDTDVVVGVDAADLVDICVWIYIVVVVGQFLFLFLSRALLLPLHRELSEGLPHNSA